MRLAAEGDTADRLATIPVISADWFYATIIKQQVIDSRSRLAGGWDIVTSCTCAIQAIIWIDPAAPDKHQRRLYNSIRISWGFGDEVGEATVWSGVAGGEGEAFQKNNIFDRLLRMEDGWLDYLW